MTTASQRCEQCDVPLAEHPDGDGVTACPGDFGPDVQTVTILDIDVMRLAIEALDADNAGEARRILTDRVEWYATLSAAVQANRRRRYHPGEQF